VSSRSYVLRLELPAADARVRELLSAAYPSGRLSGRWFEVPLDGIGAEEVLAECCAARIPVAQSSLAPADEAG